MNCESDYCIYNKDYKWQHCTTPDYGKNATTFWAFRLSKIIKNSKTRLCNVAKYILDEINVDAVGMCESCVIVSLEKEFLCKRAYILKKKKETKQNPSAFVSFFVKCF